MQSHTNAISDDRRQRAYQEGISFQQFLDNAQVNQDLLRRNYDAYELTDQELSYFQSLAEPVDVLVLAHDWCGDVASNLPLVAKIEQLTGKLKLHILIRDPDNWDIAEAYPAADGKHRLPTYIFFNSKGQELGTFIERPAEITEMIPGWRAQFWEQHPEWNWDGRTVNDIGEEGKAAWYAYLLEQRGKVRNIEKEAIIRAIKQIIG
jgi:hypothetical protein